MLLGIAGLDRSYFLGSTISYFTVKLSIPNLSSISLGKGSVSPYNNLSNLLLFERMRQSVDKYMKYEA
jgi:hypothetical protein